MVELTALGMDDQIENVIESGNSFDPSYMTTDSDIRAFVAIALPVRVKTVLSSLIDGFTEQQPDSVRWVRPENVHLTLRFLGAVPVKSVPRITTVINDIASRSAPFRLALSDAGGFPSLRAPRVFWISIAGEVDRLTLLQSRLEGVLCNMGFMPVKRPFSPHLTVGRSRKGSKPRDLRRAGEHFRWSGSNLTQQFDVKSVTFFRSHLGPFGARYEVLAVSPLGSQ